MGLGFGEGFAPIDNIEIIFENDSVLIDGSWCGNDHKWHVVAKVENDYIETVEGFKYPREWIDKVLPFSDYID
tara:strand:- start:59 stop:277 length:219 start_codon:yes stop_codon:yes gene_type:complete